MSKGNQSPSALRSARLRSQYATTVHETPLPPKTNAPAMQCRTGPDMHHRPQGSRLSALPRSQTKAEDLEPIRLHLRRLQVPGEHLLLVLHLVAVPEECCFAVERGRTITHMSAIHPHRLKSIHARCAGREAGDSLIRLPQQTLHTQQHAPRIQHRAPRPRPLHSPSRFENIQTYPPPHVNIRMIYGRAEHHLRRRVGVVGGILDGEFEGQAGVRCVGGAGEGGGPVRYVGFGGEGGEAGGGGGDEG